jgi:hypothetical protein
LKQVEVVVMIQEQVGALVLLSAAGEAWWIVMGVLKLVGWQRRQKTAVMDGRRVCP